MAQMYIRKKEIVAGEEVEPEEEPYFDGTDPDIKQAWEESRYQLFFDRKLEHGMIRNAAKPELEQQEDLFMREEKN